MNQHDKDHLLKNALNNAFEYGEAVRKEKKKFSPGVTYIPPSGKHIGGEEISNAVQAAYDVHFTEGHFVDEFERSIREYVGMRYASMCNSGSSANLLAVAALTSKIVTPENRQAILEYTSLMIAAGTQMLSILPLQANNQRIPITVDIWNRYEILKRMDMCKQGATENVLIQRLPETNSIVRISDRLSVLGFCAATSTERKLIGQLAVTNHIIAYGKRPFKVSVWVGGEQKERMHYSIKTQHCIDDAITQFYSKIDEE